MTCGRRLHDIAVDVRRRAAKRLRHRRQLFPAVADEKRQRFLGRASTQQVTEFRRRWDFDPETMQPVPGGRYEWTELAEESVQDREKSPEEQHEQKCPKKQAEMAGTMTAKPKVALKQTILTGDNFIFFSHIIFFSPIVFFFTYTFEFFFAYTFSMYLPPTYTFFSHIRTFFRIYFAPPPILSLILNCTLFYYTFPQGKQGLNTRLTL